MPMDPKLKRWIGQMMRSTIMAAVHSLLFRLPRWALILIIGVLVAGVVYFGMY